MPKWKIRVSDTITYERTAEIEVSALTEAEALNRARAAALSGDVVFDEYQIDNTPYEMELVE